MKHFIWIKLAVLLLLALAFATCEDPSGSETDEEKAKEALTPEKVEEIVSSSTLVTKSDAHADNIYAAALNPAGTRLVTGGQGGDAKLWNAETATELATLGIGGAGATRIHSFAFNQDGTILAGGAALARVYLWDGSGNRITTLGTGNGIGAGEVIHSLVFNADGTKLYAGGEQRKIYSWRTDDFASPGTIVNSTVYTVGGNAGSFEEISLSRDGSRLLGVIRPLTGFSKVVIWNEATGAEIISFDVHGKVYSAVFLEDESKIVTVSGTGDLGIWDASTGNKILDSRKAGERFYDSFPFFSDNFLFTGSQGGKLQVWKIGDLTLFYDVPGTHTETIRDIVVQGNKIITVGDDERIVFRILGESIF